MYTGKQMQAKQVKITVTAAGSGKTDYLLTIQRKEKTFRHQHLQKYRSVRTMENDLCSHGIFTGCTDAYQQQGPQGKEDRRQKTDTHNQGNGYQH